MSAASDLTEKMERETGQRVDDNGGDNAAMGGVVGALARIMGASSHAEHDDVVAGLLILHMATQEYRSERESRKLIAGLLAGGMSPDQIREMWGG